MCHVLFLIPLMSLFLFGIFPWQEATELYTLINMPILVAGWLVWRVHRRTPVTGKEGLIGREAMALTALAPEGRVRCGNELWYAQSNDHVAAGEVVRILRVENLRLSVAPVREDEPGLTQRCV
jgi:membrane-bound ClpP family serine protease